MHIKVGINGFGRMGRLALRVAWGSDEVEFVHVNELNADAHCSAHLLKFDSVHGRWPHDVSAFDNAVVIYPNDAQQFAHTGGSGLERTRCGSRH